MPWLLNFKAWCSLTEALKYLVVASMIAGLVLPRVWKIKSHYFRRISHSGPYTQPLSLPLLFCSQCCLFPDLDDRMTRSAGRWSPFAALITSPTATWYYQPRTSRGRERESVAVVHTGGEGRVREDEDRKVEMERKKINKETNSKHIRGERQRFQFLVDEKSTTISPVWSEVLFPFSANHLETAKQLAALGCCPTRGHVLTQMRLPYLFKKNFGTIFNRF